MTITTLFVHFAKTSTININHQSVSKHLGQNKLDPVSLTGSLIINPYFSAKSLKSPCLGVSKEFVRFASSSFLTGCLLAHCASCKKLIYLCMRKAHIVNFLLKSIVVLLNKIKLYACQDLFSYKKHDLHILRSCLFLTWTNIWLSVLNKIHLLAIYLDPTSIALTFGNSSKTAVLMLSLFISFSFKPLTIKHYCISITTRCISILLQP